MDEKLNQTQPGVASPTPPTTPPVQSLKNNKPVTLMIVINLIAIVAVGYFVYQNIQLKKQISSLQTTPIVSTTPTASATTNPTANWKTFTDTKYGFSFKYPDNLSGTVGVVASPYTGTSELVRTFSDSTTVKEGTDASFDGFSLYVVTDTKTSNFENYIQNEKTAMDTSPNAFMSGATRINIDSGAALINNNRGYYYLHSSDNKITVVFAYIQANESFKGTFNQILSTFKFTQ